MHTLLSTGEEYSRQLLKCSAQQVDKVPVGVKQAHIGVLPRRAAEPGIAMHKAHGVHSLRCFAQELGLHVWRRGGCWIAIAVIDDQGELCQPDRLSVLVVHAVQEAGERCDCRINLLGVG